MRNLKKIGIIIGILTCFIFHPTYLINLGNIAAGLYKNAHIGLVVFNMKTLVPLNPIRAGIYVWDGTKWRNLAIQ